MTTKTKNAKSAAANTVNADAIVSDFAQASTTHKERLNMLLAMPTAGMSAQEEKEHKSAILAAKNRAERCAEFAAILADAACAAVFMRYNLTQKRVEGLQIYAQDKLQDVLRSLAMNVALSACGAKTSHANMSTQAVFKAINEHGPRTHAQLVGDLNTITGKALSTCSAQASSSRQVLELLGMLDYSPVGRTFALNDNAREVFDLLAA